MSNTTQTTPQYAPELIDIWTAHDDGFSPITGRPLASICDMWNRVIAKGLLKEDADLIVEAVNARI